MKYFLILILSLMVACNHVSDQGFTNKAEADNEWREGYREGKWRHYVDSNDKFTQDSTAPYYTLRVYEKGKPTGMQRTYYRDGKIKDSLCFIDGIQNGPEKGYYESGKLEIEANWIDGKIVGVLKNYKENGRVDFELPYVNGHINGTTKAYYETGILKIETPHLNGKQCGIQKKYYPSGKLLAEIPFDSNGVENGLGKEYYESGKLFCEIPIINNHLNGRAKVYDTLGRLKSEDTFTDDEVGIPLNYDNNGKEIK